MRGVPRSLLGLVIGITGLAVLVLMYVLPYIVFYSVKDMSLYISWLLLTSGYAALAVSSLDRLLAEEGEEK